MSELITYNGNFNNKNSIALIWHIDDVKFTLKDMQEREWFKKKYGKSIELTDEDCMDILVEIKDNHDASLGVCWETIEYYIDRFLEENK